ncbi:MAG TPA: hypothetical protein VFQ24_07685 [Terriglobia bacterium]|nr:hypothetical protein [Terriglobia bacterium]
MMNDAPNLAHADTATEVLAECDRHVLNHDLAAPAGRQPSSIVRLKRFFSFPVFLGAILVVANFAIERGLRMDPDTWWHLKYGDTILQTGYWPTVDTWSFTVHGMPRVAYEWGGEVLTALAYRLGGLRGMDVLLIALTSAIVLLMYYFAWLRCRNCYAAFFATFILLPVAVLCFTLRPQLLGYIFLLVTLIALERFRLGEQKHLWALPLVFLLWVNTHGSFTLGFMILGLYWLSGLTEFSSGGLYAVRWQPEQRLHLELVGLLSVAVLPLTPYGTRLAAVPFDVATSLPLNFTHIIEWQPINTELWQAKLLLVLVFGFFVAQVAFRLRYRLDEISLFLIVLYATFVHFRFAILFAIVFAPLAASIFVAKAPTYDPSNDKYALNAALTFLAIAAIVWLLPSQTALRKNVSRDYPVQAVRYIQEHPVPGRMFNSYDFGGYLVWALAPEHKAFIDGRGDVYEYAGVFSDYATVVQLKPQALAVLQSYQIDSCLIQPDGSLATLLASSPDWKEVYKDGISSIFVHRTAKSFPSNGVAAAGPRHSPWHSATQAL